MNLFLLMFAAHRVDVLLQAVKAVRIEEESRNRAKKQALGKKRQGNEKLRGGKRARK